MMLGGLRWGLLVPLVFASAQVAHAETWIVGRDASTVQATIERARPGDVVVVPEGIWRERVHLDRAIVLRGQGGVLDGGGQGTVLTVDAPHAVVEGLRIRGSGDDLGAPDACIFVSPTGTEVTIRDNRLSDCAFGMWLHRAHGARVEANVVEGRAEVRVPDRGNGIHLFDCSFVTVRGNVVRRARDGLYVSATDDSLLEGNDLSEQRYGIHYMYSMRNVVRGNVVHDNLGGIALMESDDLLVEENRATDNERFGLLFRDTQRTLIARNRLERNGLGIFFFNSNDNVLRDNLVAANLVGAKIWAGSNRNEVRGNAFLGNRQPVFYVGSEDLRWGVGGRGNYWSDYVGWDQDGDGVGDRPYRADAFVAHLLYRYPAAAWLLRSPALELLQMLEARMPLLRVPTVVDVAPLSGPPRWLRAKRREGRT